MTIRSFLLSILFITILAGSTHAQVIKSIGLRIGWASTLPEVEELQNGEPVNDNIYNRNMIYPELQAELFPRDHFSLLANFAYISKGFGYWKSTPSSWGGNGFNGIFPANVDYFTITAAPKFSWQINNITLYGFAGPYVGFRNAYNAYYKQGLYFMGNFEDVQVIKPKTWGGTIGTGIEFGKKNKRLYYSAQAQYMQDFTNAVDFTYNYTDTYGRNYDYRFKAKFQTFLLSFGLHYRFKKQA